jgi:hypothetical protein
MIGYYDHVNLAFDAKLAKAVIKFANRNIYLLNCDTCLRSVWAGSVPSIIYIRKIKRDHRRALLRRKP